VSRAAEAVGAVVRRVGRRLKIAGVALTVILLASPAAAAPPIRHEVDVEGHKLAVWQKRAAQPRAAILLVHGRTWSSLPNFDLQVGSDRSFMDALAASGLDVYAVDLRGYGATPRDASGWLTPDRAVADVLAVIEWLRGPARSAGRQVYVLGLSRGAMVAALAAQRAPEKFAGVVLLGFGLDPDLRVASVEAPASPPRKRNTTDAAISDFITPDAVSGATIDAFARAALRADPVYADWRDEQQFNAFAPSKLIVPSLLVTGERDPQAPMSVQVKLFARFGTADKAWVILPGADHAAHLEKSQGELIRTITWFIRRHDTSPPSTP
jgi:alpha-beta hydrolase superfamily lysophospholipase